MLEYENQTAAVGGALPAFLTITMEAIVFQSVTTFPACNRHVADRHVAIQKIVCSFFIPIPYPVSFAVQKIEREVAFWAKLPKRPKRALKTNELAFVLGDAPKFGQETAPVSRGAGVVNTAEPF